MLSSREGDPLKEELSFSRERNQRISSRRESFSLRESSLLAERSLIDSSPLGREELFEGESLSRDEREESERGLSSRNFPPQRGELERERRALSFFPRERT